MNYLFLIIYVFVGLSVYCALEDEHRPTAFLFAALWPVVAVVTLLLYVSEWIREGMGS